MSAEIVLYSDILFGILGFILLLYAVLDGFDLGVGIVSLAVRDEHSRGLMMGSLGTVWDANETWLVLFGGIIFGAFPAVYGIALNALYLPLMLMLVGLIFRAVSFEFRSHSKNPKVWSLAFGGGSLVAAGCQGLALGGVMNGVRVTNMEFSGGVLDWFNVFSFAVAAAVISIYILLGSTYLIMKTEGRIRRIGQWGAGFGVLAALFIEFVGFVWAGFKYAFVPQKWFSFPGFFVTAVPIILSTLCLSMVIVGLAQARTRSPFYWSVGAVSGIFIAMASSYYPHLLPPNITAPMTAAAPDTMRVMIVVIAILLPILVTYNFYQYWVFRGKVTRNVYDEE